MRSLTTRSTVRAPTPSCGMPTASVRTSCESSARSRSRSWWPTSTATRSRNGPLALGRGVTTELQADCYAGAFAGAVMAGQVPSLRATRDDFSRPLLALFRLGDPPGTRPNTKTAHGNGFDRVSSFLAGMSGAPSCAQYANAPPALTAQSFADQGDRARRGNLAVSDVVTEATTDLDDHYRVIAGRRSARPGPNPLRSATSTGRQHAQGRQSRRRARSSGAAPTSSSRPERRLVSTTSATSRSAPNWPVPGRFMPKTRSLSRSPRMTPPLNVSPVYGWDPCIPVRRSVRRDGSSCLPATSTKSPEQNWSTRSGRIRSTGIAATLRGFTDGLPACVRTTPPGKLLRRVSSTEHRPTLCRRVQHEETRRR